jgi:predicted nucleotidyltransferase
MATKKSLSITKIKKILPAILRSNHVRRAYIFGSVSRGESTRQSDIDIALTFSRVPSLVQLSALRRQLSDAVDTPVDIVLERSMHPRIRKAAHKDFVRII